MEVMLVTVVLSDRTSVPSTGTRDAATVDVDDSSFSVLSGVTVQTVLVSADVALDALGDEVVALALVVDGVIGDLGDFVTDAELTAALAPVAADATAALADVAALDAATRLVGSGVGTVVANTAVETTVVTVDTPAVAAGDVLRLRLFGELLNNSGAPVTFRPRVKLGATTVLAGAAVAQADAADPVAWVVDVELLVEAVAVQRVAVSGRQGAPAAAGVLGVAAAGPLDVVGVGGATENLATAKALVVTVQMGTADPAATFLVEGWSLMHLRA